MHIEPGIKERWAVLCGRLEPTFLASKPASGDENRRFLAPRQSGRALSPKVRDRRALLRAAVS